jgi:hypothetical protein
VRVYRLTGIGKSVAANPNSGDTPGLKIVNFLRKHNGVASDDLIIEWTGVTRSDIQKLEPRIIQAIG